MKHLHFNILVIGAGPAGLAAAATAAQHTTHVGLIDDNPLIGGQIWRHAIHSLPTAQAKQWLSQVSTDHITILNDTKIIAPLKPGVLLAETATTALELHFQRLILATGARELFLPFPGWTLPGVLGAGALQALVKGGLPIQGKRVVVAGSGPLLLAVATYLKSKGAHIQLLAEQASGTTLARFALHLPCYPQYLGQTIDLLSHLPGIPIHTACWIKQANGTEHLASVTLYQHRRSLTIPCDYLACGFGLVPNNELPSALGCTTYHGAVAVDAYQQTTIPSVYAAGEVTGIAGLDASLLEGQIAALAATDRQDAARQHFRRRQRTHYFASLLTRSFALRRELASLPDDDTIVCRCEDVSYHDISQYKSWRSAKLNTRCGMGPCQGRVCGAATAFLFGWGQDSVRPPITTARLASLAHIDTTSDQEHKKEETTS